MYEAREGVIVREFGIAVEQECGDVAVGETTRVQLLQVRRQVREALSVEELREASVKSSGRREKDDTRTLRIT